MYCAHHFCSAPVFTGASAGAIGLVHFSSLSLPLLSVYLKYIYDLCGGQSITWNLISFSPIWCREIPRHPESVFFLQSF